MMKKDEIDLLLKMPLPELIGLADKVRRENIGDDIDLCSILNAKSGACSENCKFCAQSAHHSTSVLTYPLVDKNEIIEAAKAAKKNGARRFGVVTSGNILTSREVDVLKSAILQIKETVDIIVCASLGELSFEDLKGLKDSGLARYHHNIETSRNFFPNIVSSHSFDDRIKTIISAKSAGLEVCSGGIIGLGESMEDRVDMALCLKELNVDSVPLNILVPIKGTKLEGANAISCQEVIRTFAIFRIILKDKPLKIAAGRESVLKDFQALAFLAGANGMLIGGYLTVKGRPLEDDWNLVEEVRNLWKQ